MATINPLDAALSGLKISQQRLNLTSTNIANADTPGYSKQILPQETIAVEGVAVGVRGGNVTRVVNEVLYNDLLAQTSIVSSLDVQNSYIDQVTLFHGPPEAEISVSAELNKLQENFSVLATNPEDEPLLEQTVRQAERYAQKTRDFADLIDRLRAETEVEISAAVDDVNNLLEQIGQLNVMIASNYNADQSTSGLEDKRDYAMEQLAEYIDLSSFKRTDGTLVVQTKQGELLADEQGRSLYFDPSNTAVGAYYPDSLNGLMINNVDPNLGTDLTERISQGKLAGLFKLRDEILPSYTAQIDELSQKIANRFETQGLTLFTNNAGTVPANIAAPNAVDYYGFSSDFQVNEQILADYTLLRSGTTGNTVPAGSGEIFDKILDYAFGEYEYQRAQGNVDISGGGDLFTLLGVSGEARKTGDASIGTLVPAEIADSTTISSNETFQLQVGANPAATVTITAAMTADDLVDAINVALPAGSSASLTSGGYLNIIANDDLIISDGLVNGVGATGISVLGLEFETVTASNPSFSVQLGNQVATSVEITSTDTEAELLTKLNAIDGVTAQLDANGYLQIQPTEGGSLSIIDGLSSPADALGVNNITFVSHDSFRSNNLGPNADLSTDITTAYTITEFSHRVVSEHARDKTVTQNWLDSETSFKDTLKTRHQDISAVNIDEEVAELLRVQSYYSASAKTISTVQELFERLIDAV